MPSPVVLSTVPAEAFLVVLEFLYTNSAKLQRHSVLEVLTAAVEYGLEELREVGSWVAISFPLPLMGSVHTLPHTPANLERNVHQYRKKYGYLYIKTGIDACLYAKGYVCAL